MDQALTPHTTVPNSLPMPAVRAMANAPQNVTRAVARRTFAPPALAPIAPRRARKPKRCGGHDRDKRAGGRHQHHEQRHGRADRECRGRRQRGLHGRGGGDLRNPKLIARVRAQGIFRHQLLGNLPRQRLIDAALDVDFGEFLDVQTRRSRFNSLRSRARSACSVSDCELTDTYSPAAIDMAPATSPATPGDQDIVLRGRCRRNADDQACGRDDAIVGAEDRGPQPADPVDEMALRMHVEATHKLTF